MNVFSA